MFSVVTDTNHNELWAKGYSRDSLEAKINAGYFHQYMYEHDRHKTLIVIEKSN